MAKKPAPQKKTVPQKNPAPPKSIALQKKAVPQKKIVPQKAVAAPAKKSTSAKLDDGFLDLLKSTNATEDMPTSTINPTVIGLFETALRNLKDAKTSIEQDRDIRKDIQSAIELLQFGISELKKVNK